jgi:hypothetical protein
MIIDGSLMVSFDVPKAKIRNPGSSMSHAQQIDRNTDLQ